MVNYSLWQAQTRQRTSSYIQVDTLWEQKAETTVDQSSRSVYGQLGANYEVNEHHSFGATYEGNKGFNSGADFISDNTMYANKTVYDVLHYQTRMETDVNQHKVNAYYEGRFNDKLTISFNADWLTGSSENRMFANENSEMDDDRLVTTSNRTRNRLYAVKLVSETPPATFRSRGAC